METIRKERVEKSYYDVFVANDGTEFTNVEECKKYEASALGVLRARYKNLVVKSGTEENLHDYGCSDNDVDVVKVESEKDIDTVMQLYFSVNPHIAKEDNCGWAKRADKLLHRALEEKDYLLVGRGYDNDCFYFYGTRNSMKEELDKFFTTEKND